MAASQYKLEAIFADAKFPGVHLRYIFFTVVMKYMDSDEFRHGFGHLGDPSSILSHDLVVFEDALESL